MRKDVNSQSIFCVHRHGHRFIVLEHQYGSRDVTWKRSIGPPSSYTTTSDHVTEPRSRGDKRAKYICWEKPVGGGQTLQGYYKWTFELVLSFQDAFLSSVFSLNFEYNNYCVNFNITFSTISPSLKKPYGNNGSSSKLKRNPDILQRAHWQWRTQIDDTLYPSYHERN